MKRRNGEIEFLRFVFAIVIILRHISSVIYGFFIRGSLGVEFFFIVSGYLMASTAKRKNDEGDTNKLGTETFQFIMHKYLGLMPEFVFAWGASFVIAHLGKTITLSTIVNDIGVWIYLLIPVSMAGFTGGEFHMAAWYISAMLLAMYILYPFCRKYYDMFTRVIAPLLAIFIIGILYLNYKTVLGPTSQIGLFTFRGFPRAIAEISLGAALYPLAEDLSNKNFNAIQRKWASVLSGICLLLSLAWMGSRHGNKYDVTCVFLVAVVILIAFSNIGALSDKFDKEICYKLGKMSLTLYLCNAEWSWYFADVLEKVTSSGLMEDTRYLHLGITILYIVATFATALLVTWMSDMVRKGAKNRRKEG